MAMRTGCCLSITPPPTPNHSVPIKKAQVSWLKNEGSWRNQSILVVGLACTVIGLEFGNLVSSEQSHATAKDDIIMMYLVSNSKEKLVAKKWSDERTCPSWRHNSLETIMPENLPRPTARRRWEAVGYSKNAPPLTLAVKSKSKCFSM
ncbi:Histone deacetylase-like protein [Quillaja saponaria]|uniref:Histone deacetylase-like protein n=1 Tax=Quillaja saponaria TaxID=32244 RepID=A0AAD7LZU6_QUISA|nr:Histone deacetylase-like protein [Quillaja saponaria]